MKIITVKLESDKDAETLRKVLSETEFKDKIETFEEDEITDGEFRMLEERWEEYLKNPSSVISLDDFKKEIKAKYGF